MWTAALVIAALPLACLALKHFLTQWPRAFALAALGGVGLGDGASQVPVLLAPFALPAAAFVISLWLINAGVAVAGAAACGALGWAPAALEPSLKRLAGNWQRLCSRHTLTQGLFVAFGLALCLGISVRPLAYLLKHLTLPLSLESQTAVVWHASQALWLRTTAVALALGAIDLWWQRRRHQTQLRMTTREVRDDRAQTEARPEIKRQRKTISAKRSRSLRLSAIKRATAIVVNPSHVGVALRYAPPAIDVPIIVARAANRLVRRLREEAALHSVPVIESPALARELYARVDVDDAIPEDCYAAVAAIFAWIVRTHGMLRGNDE